MIRDNRFAVLMFTLTAAGSMTKAVHAKNEPAFSALASTGRRLTVECEGNESTCNGLVGTCTSKFNCTYDAVKGTCRKGESCGDDLSMTSVCGGTVDDDCDGNLNQCMGGYNCTSNGKNSGDACTSSEECTLGPDEVRIANGTNSTTPTAAPTTPPTAAPTASPTAVPTASPSAAPTSAPTVAPTPNSPTAPNGTNSTTQTPNSAFAESRLGPQALLLLSALQLVGWKLLQ